MSLYQRYLNYLNQGMPDISGIFSNITTTPDDPTNDPVMDPEPGVTPQLLQLTGGGDNFSVYNPDPTRTRTNYINPFPFNPDDNLGTSDYGYIEPRRDGILGLMDAGVDYLNNSLLGRGLRAARDMLPVNPRAILENELIGKGIMLDDIGRIVTNDYNTPEGIMAGYNAAKMDASTFDDRIANIEKTIARKTAADPNYDPSNLQNRIELIEQAKTNFFDAKDAAEVITDAKKKKKDPTYQTLDEKVALGLAEGDDDDDDYNFEDYIASMNPYGIPTGITASSYPGVGLKNRRDIIQDISEQNIQDAIDRGRERDIQRQIEIEKAAEARRDMQTKIAEAEAAQKRNTANNTPPSQRGGGGGGYSPPSRSQNEARTSSRVSGGRTRAYGL